MWVVLRNFFNPIGDWTNFSCFFIVNATITSVREHVYWIADFGVKFLDYVLSWTTKHKNAFFKLEKISRFIKSYTTRTTKTLC